MMEPALFFIACEKGHLDVVLELLGDVRVDVEKTNDLMVQPLIAAVSRDHGIIVKLLLESGRLDRKNIKLHWPLLQPYLLQGKPL